MDILSNLFAEDDDIFKDLDQLQSIHTKDCKESTLKAIETLNNASRLNLMDPSLKYTLFFPNDGIPDTVDFGMFWNRHVVQHTVSITGSHVIEQVRMLSKVSHALYFDGNRYRIGLQWIEEMNILHNNVIVHIIDAPLSEVRLVKGSLVNLPLITLGLQRFTLKFESLGQRSIELDDMTLHIVFICSDSRKCLSTFRKPWCLENMHMDIQIPNVQTQKDVAMVIRLVSNPLGIDLIYWMRPQNMTVYPNMHLQPNPHVYEFVPRSARENQVLWVHGEDFSPSVRVNVGLQAAIIYYCSNSLIKCIIPRRDDACDNANGTCNIQVANGNVYVTAGMHFQFVQ